MALLIQHLDPGREVLVDGERGRIVANPSIRKPGFVDIDIGRDTVTVHRRELQLQNPNVHVFSSSQEACDAVDGDSSVARGDILIIPSENVVGVANEFPFAVSIECGELFRLDDVDLSTTRHFNHAYSIACAELYIDLLAEAKAAGRPIVA